MKIVITFIILLVGLPSYSSDIVSSCESSIESFPTDGTGRSNLSDICYTQYEIGESDSGDYHFLQWAGYWDTSTNKTLPTIASWAAALTAVPSASGWRLPTIKELSLLVDFSNHDESEPLAGSLSSNWMIQRWLSSLTGDYLLSSTINYDGSQLMVLNIKTAAIESIPATSFPTDSVYMLKVKEQSPEWSIIENSLDFVGATEVFNGRCLNVGRDADGIFDQSEEVKLLPCEAGDLANQGWRYETNTNLLRSHRGQCAEPIALEIAEGGRPALEIRTQLRLSDCSNANARLIRTEREAVDNTGGQYYFTLKSNENLFLYGADTGGGVAPYVIDQYEVPLWGSRGTEKYYWTFSAQ